MRPYPNTPAPPSAPAAIEPLPSNHRDRLCDAILSIVRRLDSVTFVALPKYLAEVGFAETEGDAAITLPDNVVVWGGFSVDLADAIRSLLDGAQLFLHRASVLAYVADGAVLGLPIARRPRRGYRRPRWLVSCLRAVPVLKDGEVIPGNPCAACGKPFHKGESVTVASWFGSGTPKDRDIVHVRCQHKPRKVNQ